MIKTVEEEQVVKVCRDIICCDICEEEQRVDTALLLIKPALVAKHGDTWTTNIQLIVCPSCLADNSKTIKLLLDTKFFAELKTSFANRKADTKWTDSKSDRYSTPGIISNITK